jgi:hypothetical protein
MKLPLEGRWLALAAAVFLAFVGILVVAVRFVTLPSPQTQKLSEQKAGGIGLAPAASSANSALLRERSLFDPDPLFLPTQFNASQLRLPADIRREPGANFVPISAKYAFAERAAPIAFPEAIAVPAQPAESLSYVRDQNLYDVLGRFNREEAPLPGRLAFIEVVEARTGKMVFSTAVNLASAPTQLTSADWRPLELLAAVDSTGTIGLPVVARGSGVEDVDKFFRSYLAKQFHLGERLPPGFYSLRVGP